MSATATTKQSDLVCFLKNSHLACIEIGLIELEGAAGHDASQIHANEITGVTVAALRNRPAHVTDILFVSSWLHAEAHCTEAQRAVIRKHWLTIAQSTEDAIS